MEFEYTLAGARRAAERGRLFEWTQGKVLREGRANRPLAAILRGQNALLSGPVEVPLAGLERIAGGEPGLKYSVTMDRWEGEIAPLMTGDPEAHPPALLRYGRHVADGNHRVDAWRRRGFSHIPAIVWEDSDPRFRDWWTPFLPEVSPTFERRGESFVAVSQGRVVGSLRLAEGELSGLFVEPAWRGLRLGARLLRRATPLMAGRAVRAVVPPRLVRLFSETGFVPVGVAGVGIVLVREG